MLINRQTTLRLSPPLCVLFTVAFVLSGCKSDSGIVTPKERTVAPSADTEDKENDGEKMQDSLEDKAKRICGGGDVCLNFVQSHAELGPLTNALLKKSQAGRFGPEDIQPASKAVALAQGLKKLSCTRGSVVGAFCKQMKTIYSELRKVERMARKEFRKYLLQHKKLCQRAKSRDLRNARRGKPENASFAEGFDDVDNRCTDYFRALRTPGTPHARMHEAAEDLGMLLAREFTHSISTCSQEETRARMAKCSRDNQRNLCNEHIKPFMKSYGNKGKRWLKRNAHFLPLRYPLDVGVKIQLRRCSTR